MCTAINYLCTDFNSGLSWFKLWHGWVIMFHPFLWMQSFTKLQVWKIHIALSHGWISHPVIIRAGLGLQLGPKAPNFTWGPNEPNTIGAFVRNFNAGALQNLFWVLVNSQEKDSSLQCQTRALEQTYKVLEKMTYCRKLEWMNMFCRKFAWMNMSYISLYFQPAICLLLDTHLYILLIICL